MGKEYINQRWGIAALAGFTALICFGLSLLSYEEGAGTAAFRISLGIVVAESIVILLLYCSWYRDVNDRAKKMYDLAVMQAMAKRQAFKAQGKILVFSLAAGGAGAALILLGILFSGISTIFSYSAVLSELLGGNILFFLLTHSIFLPDRIVGRC